MGTTGNSTGVHLHFEIRQGSNKQSSAIDPLQFFNEDGTPVGGGLAEGEYPSQDIQDLVQKAISMAQKPSVLYRQSGRQVVGVNIKNMDEMTKSDCSGFVQSLYKQYLGINIGNAGEIWRRLENGKTYSEGGWTGKMYTYNGNLSTLQPGDLLEEPGVHVALYVGNGMLVDLGGPGGLNSESNPSWKGPLHNKVPSGRYTHYIRYTNPSKKPPSSGSSSGQLVIGNKVNTSPYNNAFRYFKLAEKWGTKYGIDPYLIIAMIATESGGDPNAANGSGGGAGLMQIERGVYANKNRTLTFLDGSKETVYVAESKLFDPEFNMKIGCSILFDNLLNARGNIPVAIQGYNYGITGIKSCITKYLNGRMDYFEYLYTLDLGWLSARKNYGSGTPDHLEKVLSYYNKQNGMPYYYDFYTKKKIVMK